MSLRLKIPNGGLLQPSLCGELLLSKTCMSTSCFKTLGEICGHSAEAYGKPITIYRLSFND